MTDTERLSLHGRLRMAAACPDPNASLLAEAADAIEQHEAFRQEVSDAVDAWWHGGRSVETIKRFIIAKPDPLVEAVGECDDGTWQTKAEYAQRLRAAIEKRGGKIVWGEG